MHHKSSVVLVFVLWVAGAMANWVSLHKLLLFGLLTGAGISLAQADGLPLYLLMISRVLEGASHQTLAYGALAQTGNIGNLPGTPVMLSVLSASNFTTMTGLIMACYLLALGVHILLAKRRNVSR